jgi:Tfp pilus assembly protein PilO
MNIELGNNVRTYTALCAALILAIIGVACYHFLAPYPSPKAAERRTDRQIERAESDLKRKQETLANLKSGEKAVWQGAAQTVLPQVLQSVSILAKAQDIKLKTFRPQAPITDGEVTRATYLTMVEGPFPQVAAFIRSIDRPDSQLATSTIQISALDQESDLVTATVGILAYITPSVAPKNPNEDPNAPKTEQESEKSPNQQKPANTEPASTLQLKGSPEKE